MSNTTENKMTIRTNNVARPIIDAWELTEKEQAEFDYLDWDAIKEGNDSASFFRYRGQLYDMGQFCRVIPQGAVSHHPCDCQNPDFAGWHGYMSDSFFSGMLVRYVDDESIVVGVYSC